MSSKKTYYHYTDKRGAEGIAKSKEIKASTDTKTDARFGTGVYLTRKDPVSNDPKEIIRNNYDDGQRVVNNPEMVAKVENVVEVKLDSNEVQKVSNDRDVYLYKGDLDLNKHEHKIQKNPNTKNTFVYI